MPSVFRATALLLCTASACLPAGAQPSTSEPAPAALAALATDAGLVHDARAQLVWQRCAVGMEWRAPHCVGQAQLMTHAEALALAARMAKADGQRWRLPRVKELQRLRDRSLQPPRLNEALFPDAPGGWHWSGNASVNTGTVNPYAYDNVARQGAGASTLSMRQAWAVDLDTGEAAGDMGRGNLLPVRLVRPAAR